MVEDPPSGPDKMRPSTTGVTRRATYGLVAAMGLAVTGGAAWAMFPFHRTGNEVQAATFAVLFGAGTVASLAGGAMYLKVRDRRFQVRGWLLAACGATWVGVCVAAGFGAEDTAFVLLLLWSPLQLLGLGSLWSKGSGAGSATTRVGVVLIALAAVLTPAVGFLFEFVFLLYVPGLLFVVAPLLFAKPRLQAPALMLLVATAIAGIGLALSAITALPGRVTSLLFIPIGLGWIVLGRRVSVDG